MGIDDTPRRRNQTYISSMADLDGYKVAAAAQGKDKGTQACSATSLRSTSTGQPSSSPATWLKAYPLGVAFKMPQAAQSTERFHLM